jgi:hypothetical protein
MAACGQLGNEAIRNRRWVGGDAPGPAKEIVEIRVADA